MAMRRWRVWLLGALAALLLAGGCAWYRGEQCQDARLRVQGLVPPPSLSVYPRPPLPGQVEARIAVQRWCGWPWQPFTGQP